MPAVTYKCPACGGPLAFDPATGRFGCDFCHSQYDEGQLTRSATESPKAAPTPEGEAQMVTYNCPSCGAQVVTSQTTAATLCYFCHNPVVLESRVSDGWKPDAVLPFTVSKEEACKRFLSWAKKKRFVPKEFSLQDTVDHISGVYYPYWLSKVEMDAAFDGEGQQVSVATTQKYIVTTTKHYHVVRKGHLAFQNLYRSALSTADRTLAQGVQPFKVEGLKPFTPQYLAGFLAEKRDVESAAIQPDVEKEAQGYARDQIRPQGVYDTVTGQAEVSGTQSTHQYVLLPAWVITYKDRKGKVESYIINGQTGTTCGKLPVSGGKLAIGWAGVSAALFALLCVGGYFIW